MSTNKSAHTNLEPKTPFEAGYKAYIDTAMRLVEHEIELMCNTSFDCSKLHGIKCGLQIAIDNMEHDYSSEAQAISQLEIFKQNEFGGVRNTTATNTRFNFGGKAD